MSYKNPLFCFLINLYDPNNEAEQIQTIEKVKLGIDQLDPDHDCNIIFWGDFNFIQDSVYGYADRGSPNLKLFSTAELKKSRDLVDIWHICNPFTKRFTSRKPIHFLQRCLGYFLVLTVHKIILKFGLIIEQKF